MFFYKNVFYIDNINYKTNFIIKIMLQGNEIALLNNNIFLLTIIMIIIIPTMNTSLIIVIFSVLFISLISLGNVWLWYTSYWALVISIISFSRSIIAKLIFPIVILRPCFSPIVFISFWFFLSIYFWFSWFSLSVCF